MPVRALGIASLALLTGALGVGGIYTEVRFAPELAIAGLAERSRPVETTTLAAMVDDSRRDRGWPAPPDIGKAAMTNALALVDASVTSPQSYDAEAAESAAVDVIVRQLADSPMNGNAWFRLALLEMREGDPRSAAAHLVLSQKLAPAEGWIVQNRVRFELLAASAGLKELAPTLHPDLATYVARALPADVRDLVLTTTDEASRKRIASEIAMLPARRLDVLRRSNVPIELADP